MKNPAIFYGVIALGIIALAVGVYYLTGTGGLHPARAYAGIGVGILLLIGGVVGMFMARPKAAAK
jgi:hypothetical protein